MYYKYFEVFMHGRDSIIVTGKTRAEVGRDFKKIYGPDKVDEVKPLSVKGAESRLGLEFKQIVKSNTMINTPNGRKPYINEDYNSSLSNLETKDYGYYEVSFVGTDETDIVIGSSYDEVHADMAQLYGDNLLEVTPIQPEELVPTPDEDAPKKQHVNNISILTGRNPFAEALNKADSMGKWIKDFKKSDAPQFQGKSDEKKREMAIAAKLNAEETELDEVSIEAIKKEITAPSETGSKAFAKRKEQLKAELSAKRASMEIDRENDGRKGLQTEETLDEVSIERASKVRDRAFRRMVAGIGKTEPNPETGGKTNRYVPPTDKETETAKKAAKTARLAFKTIDKNLRKRKTGRYEAFGTVITSDMSLEEQERLINLLPSNYVQEALEALGLEEERGLWDNIHAKRKRIKAGSDEKMRKPGSEGAPSDDDLKNSRNESVMEEGERLKRNDDNVIPADTTHTGIDPKNNLRRNKSAQRHTNDAAIKDKLQRKADYDRETHANSGEYKNRARFGNDNAQKTKVTKKFIPTPGLGNPNSPGNIAFRKKQANIEKLKAIKAKLDAKKGSTEKK